MGNFFRRKEEVTDKIVIDAMNGIVCDEICKIVSPGFGGDVPIEARVIIAFLIVRYLQ